MTIEFKIKSYSRDVNPTAREILTYLENHPNPAHFYIIDSWACDGGLACIRVTEPVRKYMLANAAALVHYTDMIGISAFDIWTCDDRAIEEPTNHSLYEIKEFKVECLINKPDAAISYLQECIVELYAHEEY